MTKEDVTMVGFEIVAFAGDARSKLLEALKKARNNEFEMARTLVKQAEECLVEAHNSQTKMIQQEAGGENIEIGFIAVHAQDHLMTTILLKDIIEDFIELYQRKG
ncbi:PTS lactose/cellobiose transporter subunit IIA [Leptotrichia sp. oral taxon 218]|uniref:PTS lactose/cellobiose transporter subunit IIA n=1 Tax=Leptotrichia sp. oral taxon 218 TaxID=712361 RepID=UPI001B8B9DD2|nr:PTS lactose/cellobiose transporter subunit IIA [Leptotrichia sp. oral taxon 218]QUB95334.1 PTS lactose/cellobiose transporter subunit IIA [Leptotrichia sp. oral taxon 218]